MSVSRMDNKTTDSSTDEGMKTIFRNTFHGFKPDQSASNFKSSKNEQLWGLLDEYKNYQSEQAQQ